MAVEHLRSARPETDGLPPSRPHHRISTRIVFFVFLSTLVAAVVISWIAIDSLHRHLGVELAVRFPSVLERRAELLDEHVTALRTNLAADFARIDATRWKLADTEALTTLLNERLAGHPAFTSLTLVGSEGQVLAHTPGLAPHEAATLALATPGPSDAAEVIAFPVDLPTPSLATRFDSAAGPRSILATYDPQPIRKWLAIAPDEGPGRIILTDDEGLGFLWTGSSSGATSSPIVPLRRLSALADGSVVDYTGSDGTHLIGSARPMTAIAGQMVVEAPFADVYAPLYSVVQRILLSDLAIIVLFSLLAHRITAALMQPIEALSEGAARISRGDVRHEIPIPKARDEIGLLTRTFNEMMHKLRRSQEEIEQDKLRLTEQNEELQRANEVLAQLSITDGLTKLHNHRFFQDHLTREIKRVSRTGEPLSMLLMDLDDFKRLNDRHGHAAGDEVLMNIAGQMNANVRETDLLARYGGEEFVILTPNTDLHGAIALAEKIRMSVETTSQIIDESMRPIRVTISCGVAQYEGDRKKFFQAADRALYRAKAEGKNCVISAADEA